MKIDFDDLEPESRRIILVSSDDKYRDLIGQTDWGSVLKLVAPFVHSTPLALAAAGGAYVAKTLKLGAARSSEPSWLERATTKGEIPIPHLTPTEAARRFKFDFGEPKDGAAYVLNPCVPDHYLGPAIANERLAQEKMGAFTQVAAALGAKRVEVLSGEVLRTSAGISATVPVDEAAAQIGIGVLLDSERKVGRQIYMEFDEPDRAPFVPAHLVRWVEVDPSLRSLVQTRLTSRPRIAKVTLRFEDTIDADAQITAELAGRRIGVGGKYKQLRASTWSFEIEFWPAGRGG